VFPITIIEEKLVEARIDQALKIYPRLTEVWNAILVHVKNPSWKAANVPSITILYQVADGVVILRSSRIEELEE
jgi:hypothetical protein